MEIRLGNLQLAFTTPDGPGSLSIPLPGELSVTLTLPDGGYTPPPDPNVDWIEVRPGDDLQAKVNEAGEGASLLFKAGTYANASVIPKTGQTLQGEPGAVFDGQGVTQYAFNKGPAPYPSNVTIRGFKVTGYHPETQMAAVLAGGHYPEEGSDGWLIEGNEVCYNKESGVRIGNNCIVRNNRLHHNQRLNVGGAGNNSLVEGNEIAYGNDEGTLDPGFEAGGTKFCQCDNLVVRGNDVHHNNGPALWFDENATRMTIEDNYVHDNNTEGIVIEICYNARILNNRVINNGFNDPHQRYTWGWNSAIGIHSSPDCEVAGNYVEGNWSEIVAIQQDRSTYDNPAEYGPHEVRNLNVHDNTIVHTSAPRTPDELSLASGFVKDWGPDELFTSYGNTFTGNTYTSLGCNTPHAWANGARTHPEWQGYGLS